MKKAVFVEEETVEEGSQSNQTGEQDLAQGAATRLNRMFFAEESASSTHHLQPRAALRGVQGDQSGSIEITRQHTVIGRSSEYIPSHLGKIVIDKDEISRNHAAIRFRDMAFWLEDLDSANGTFLNSQQIHEKVRVKHRDIVQFCDETFEFLLLEEEDKSNETIMRKV